MQDGEKEVSESHQVNIGSITLGGRKPLALIAGPCVVESSDVMCRIADDIQTVTSKLGIPYIFKASYDKANKTIGDSYRGPGWMEGLESLRLLKQKTGVPVLTDIHTAEQVDAVAEVCDVLQIPALLSKQIDLILAAAKTGRPVNIKKGQWTAPWEMTNVVNRLSAEGYEDVMLTERGTSFGFQLLINDFRSLVIMKFIGKPIIFDASHSVHGAPTVGESVGGNREFIPALCRSAVACGVDALFLEVHPEPDRALSDAQGTFPLGRMADLLHMIQPYAEVSRRGT